MLQRPLWQNKNFQLTHVIVHRLALPPLIAHKVAHPQYIDRQTSMLSCRISLAPERKGLVR